MVSDPESISSCRPKSARHCFSDFCVERSVIYRSDRPEEFFKNKSQQILDYLVGDELALGGRILYDMYTQREHASMPRILAILHEDIRDFVDEIACDRFGPLVTHCCQKFADSFLKKVSGRAVTTAELKELTGEKEVPKRTRKAAASLLGLAMVIGDKTVDEILEFVKPPAMRIAS